MDLEEEEEKNFSFRSVLRMIDFLFPPYSEMDNPAALFDGSFKYIYLLLLLEKIDVFDGRIWTKDHGHAGI